MVKKVSQADLDEGLKFDRFGRMLYHPEYHLNNGKPYTEEELEYICRFFDFDDLRTLSYAVGRTETSVSNKVSQIRREGKFGYYKRLNKYYISRR